MKKQGSFEDADLLLVPCVATGKGLWYLSLIKRITYLQIQERLPEKEHPDARDRSLSPFCSPSLAPCLSCLGASFSEGSQMFSESSALNASQGDTKFTGLWLAESSSSFQNVMSSASVQLPEVRDLLEGKQGAAESLEKEECLSYGI